MCPDDALLSAYLDGEVEERWAKQIEAHLETCETCQKKIASWKSISSIIHKEDSLDFSSASRRVHNNIEHIIAGKEKKDIFHRRMFLPVPLAAAAFIAVFAFGFILPQLPGFFQPRFSAESTEEAAAFAEARTLQSPKLSSESDENDFEIVIDLPLSEELSIHGQPQYMRSTSYKGGE